VSSTCLLALATVAVASGGASARDLPLLLSLHGNGGRSPTAPWETPETADIGKAQVDSVTVVYELIAYVTKEFLDDASEEYRSSPVGAYLRKEDPTLYSRSTLPVSKPLLFTDSPSNLRYRVRGGTSLSELWSTLQTRTDGDQRGFSLNPKFGSGKAGLVLSLRW